jgi:outer membrane receptor protein involved in Fe transport
MINNRNRYKLELLIVFCFIKIGIMYSQSSDIYVISGTIVDDKRNGIAFTSILLKSAIDSSYYKGEVTDKDGFFFFKEVKFGSYYIEIKAIGFEKMIIPEITVTANKKNDLKDIRLIPSIAELNEIVILNELPQIEKFSDKTVVNVENSITSVGSSAIKIIETLPGVQVSSEGEISLNGRSNVKVFIDGKMTMLSNENALNILKGMSSSNIKKIEIMSNPSAQYDSEGKGGIINIITKKNRNEGLNGDINVSYGQGRYEKENIGVNLSVKRKWYNISANYVFMHDKNFFELHLKRDFPLINYSNTVINSNSNIIGSLNSHAPGISADFNLTKRTSISLLSNFYNSLSHSNNISNSDITDSYKNKLDSYNLLTKAYEKWTVYNNNLHFLHQIDTSGKNLTFDVDYAKYLNKNNRDNTIEINDSTVNLKNQNSSVVQQISKLNIYSIKVDLSIPMKEKVQVDAGIKSSYVYSGYDTRLFNIISENKTLDSSQSNHFLYSENINSVYINFKKEYEKITFQSGVRTEQTIIKGEQLSLKQKFKRQYIQVFPSLFLNYKINNSNEINFNLGRRITRPSYQQMNPFRLLTDIGTYSEGNPYLKPEITYGSELTYSYKNMFFSTIGYSISYNKIMFVLIHYPENAITSRSLLNLDRSQIYNIQLTYSKKIKKWWRTNTSFSPYYEIFEGKLNDNTVPKGIPSFQFNTTNTIIFNNGFSMELNLRYVGKAQKGISLIQPFYNAALGIKKAFNERLTLTVNINDVFFSDYRRGVAYFGTSDMELTSHYNNRWDSRVVTFNMIYRFKNEKVFKNDYNTGNEDEKSRINIK